MRLTIDTDRTYTSTERVPIVSGAGCMAVLFWIGLTLTITGNVLLGMLLIMPVFVAACVSASRQPRQLALSDRRAEETEIHIHHRTVPMSSGVVHYRPRRHEACQNGQNTTPEIASSLGVDNSVPALPPIRPRRKAPYGVAGPQYFDLGPIGQRRPPRVNPDFRPTKIESDTIDWGKLS